MAPEPQKASKSAALRRIHAKTLAGEISEMPFFRSLFWRIFRPFLALFSFSARVYIRPFQATSNEGPG
jgi:hypothetical protein